MANASITVERNFPPLDQMELVTAEDMRELGLLARERIVARTISGVDANGAPFQPYSDGYAKQKQAALGTTSVNLQVSGNMLNHLQIVDVSVDGDSASVTLGWDQ